MKFDGRTRSQPAGIPRKTQFKLIGLILLLGLVLLAANHAADPQTWAWLLPAKPAEVANKRSGDAAEAAFKRIGDLAPDAVRMDGSAAEIESLPRHSDTDESKAADDAARDTEGDAATETADESRRGVVRRSDLQAARDDTVGLSRAEGLSLRAIFDELGNTQHRALAAASRADVTFSVLSADSDRYRGEVLHVQGLLRRLTEASLPGTGELTLWEGWVFSDDSGDRPYRVLTLDRGELPIGEALDPVAVRFDAIYFKRTAYASVGGMGVAPLLLAKRVTGVPPKVAPPSSAAPAVLPVLVTAVTGCLLLAFLRTTATQRRRRIEFRVSAAHSDGSIDVSADSPAEFLASIDVTENDDSDGSPVTPGFPGDGGPIFVRDGDVN